MWIYNRAIFGDPKQYGFNTPITRKNITVELHVDTFDNVTLIIHNENLIPEILPELKPGGMYPEYVVEDTFVFNIEMTDLPWMKALCTMKGILLYVPCK